MQNEVKGDRGLPKSIKLIEMSTVISVIYEPVVKGKLTPQWKINQQELDSFSLTHTHAYTLTHERTHTNTNKGGIIPLTCSVRQLLFRSQPVFFS